MRKNTLLLNARYWQLGPNYRPSKAGYANVHASHLQASVSLKNPKKSSFCIPTQRQNPMKTLFTKNPLWASLGLKHGKTGISLKTDLLQNTVYLLMGLHTLTLDLLLKRLFTTSSTSNDFNNTATIWKLNAVKRRAI